MSDYQPDGISPAPPCFDMGRLHEILQRHYGLTGRLTPLVSESEQNMLVVTDTGASYVLKIAVASNAAMLADLQSRALLHLEHEHCPVATPRVVTTTSGDALASLQGPDGCHRIRLVTWVDGCILRDAGQAQDVISLFGKGLATLGCCLQGFAHEEDEKTSYWDLRRALQLRRILAHIDDNKLRNSVATVLDDFEHRILPRLADLRTQFIHNDANPDNVLIEEGVQDVGFIDFGDMLRAPLIFDVAIAASYLRVLDSDPGKLIRTFVAGYNQVSPLQGSEVELLFDLVRARLATTISMLYWRLAERPENDAYRRQTLQRENSAERFLAALDKLGREAFEKLLRDAL